jgi:competence protein ComEC
MIDESQFCRRSLAFVVSVVALVATVATGTLATADTVTPSADVANRVIVRASATSQSAQVGALRIGQSAELIGSVPNWHLVRLSNGVQGFVSKRWTRVIAAGPVPPPPVPSGQTYSLDAFDVGTGLAVLVRGADFSLLYDGGSNDDLALGADNRLLAYLKSVAPAMTTIDHVVLSHPHRDHVEYLADVLANYQVRQVWDSGRINDICGYRAFLTAVRDEPGVQYHNALQNFGTRGYSFSAKNCYGDSLPAAVLTLTHASRIDDSPVTLGTGATMTVLHADGGTHSSPNENSLVVRLNLGSQRVLLMGDAEAGGRKPAATPPASSSIEGVLLSCCASEVAAQVMVVGHHGSRTSSRKAFLDAVAASVFVVSSGPMKYGSVTLPDSDIVSELQGRGQVFRTDTNDGACATNGAKIGPDADGVAGGCDSVHVDISATGVVASIAHPTD